MAVQGLRVNAYLLAADPSWIEESVASYYHLVSRIVVSYDEDGKSWTGTDMPVQECLDRLRAIDPEGKFDYRPGKFFRPVEHPLANDTHQRQVALDQASTDADWVVQLDTDEVLADAVEFMSCIHEAESLGYTGVEYPARVLYQHVLNDLYLEQCRRLWWVAGHYPGPVAVRAGTTLRLARQGDATLFRADFRPTNTDPAHPKDAPVHRVVGQNQAIMHYSMVRSDAHMRAKSQSSGHSTDFDWAELIDNWQFRQEHPVLTVVGTPFRSGSDRRRLRLVRIPGAPGRRSRELNGLRN